MRKFLMAGAALALIGTTAAHAQERNDDQDLGVVTGGAAGAVTGAIVGGPVGAAIGGIAGATLGAAATVPTEVQTYVVANPVEPVVLEGPVTTETRLRQDVVLTPIPDHPEFAYVYVDSRPVIVRASDRQVVFVAQAETTGSIAPPVPEATITYVEKHPVGPVVLEGPVETGAVIPEQVDIVAVPDSPEYGYIYVEDRPVLVDRGSRKIVWVR